MAPSRRLRDGQFNRADLIQLGTNETRSGGKPRRSDAASHNRRASLCASRRREGKGLRLAFLPGEPSPVSQIEGSVDDGVGPRVRFLAFLWVRPQRPEQEVVLRLKAAEGILLAATFVIGIILVVRSGGREAPR